MFAVVVITKDQLERFEKRFYFESNENLDLVLLQPEQKPR